MYFPYLRGKQYELLALKERASLLGTSGSIVPVIEPVRAPDGGLERCVDALRSASVEFVLTATPQVGAVSGKGIATSVERFVDRNGGGAATWNIGLIVDENTLVSDLMDEFQQRFAGSAEALTL